MKLLLLLFLLTGCAASPYVYKNAKLEHQWLYRFYCRGLIYNCDSYTEQDGTYTLYKELESGESEILYILNESDMKSFKIIKLYK